MKKDKWGKSGFITSIAGSTKPNPIKSGSGYLNDFKKLTLLYQFPSIGYRRAQPPRNEAKTKTHHCNPLLVLPNSQASLSVISSLLLIIFQPPP